MIFNLVKLDPDMKVGVHYKQIDHLPEPLSETLFSVAERTDGPEYIGRTYNPGNDTFSPMPPPPPPTADEARLAGLETAKAANETANKVLIDSDESTWTDTERSSALHSLLREQKIQELKKKLHKP